MPDDLNWIVSAALGVLGPVALVVWRLSRRWQRHRRLRSEARRLATFDPAERVRGAVGTVELGLTRRSARMLLEHITGEEDKRVRLALAQAVTQRSEERSRRRQVRRLRAWAADELAVWGYGVTRMADRKRYREPPRISWRDPAAHS